MRKKAVIQNQMVVMENSIYKQYNIEILIAVYKLYYYTLKFNGTIHTVSDLQLYCRLLDLASYDDQNILCCMSIRRCTCIRKL